MTESVLAEVLVTQIYRVTKSLNQETHIIKLQSLLCCKFSLLFSIHMGKRETGEVGESQHHEFKTLIFVSFI